MIRIVSVSTFQKNADNPLVRNWNENNLKTENTNSFVRRPINGLSIKPDTYGCILYGGAVNTSSPLKNSAYDHNMLIQSFSLNRMEKNQVIETFGDHYVYFFGERAPTASINMVLLDSETFEWFSQFDINYDAAYRGTQNALRRAPLNIIIDGVQLTGYLQSVSYSQSASQDPYLVNTSINMVIERIYHLSDITKVKGLVPDNDNKKALQQLSSAGAANNVLTNRFKSVEDEINFLATNNAQVLPSELERQLQSVYNEYEKSTPRTYFDAYPNEYIVSKFGNVFATFDEIADSAEYVVSSYEKDRASEFFDSNRVDQLLEEFAFQVELIDENPENVGIYIDSVIPDQGLVDILGDNIIEGLDMSLTPSSKLKAKQASSMATSLTIYGLTTLASNLTGIISTAENALSGVRIFALNTVEGIFGPDRESEEDLSNSQLGKFV